MILFFCTRSQKKTYDFRRPLPKPTQPSFTIQKKEMETEGNSGSDDRVTYFYILSTCLIFSSFVTLSFLDYISISHPFRLFPSTKKVLYSRNHCNSCEKRESRVSQLNSLMICLERNNK